MHAQPRALVGELNAISHAEIDVHVRSVHNGLAAVEKWHIAEVDLPVLVPGSSGIVGKIGRSSLGERNPRTQNQQCAKQDDLTQPSSREDRKSTRLNSS